MSSGKWRSFVQSRGSTNTITIYPDRVVVTIGEADAAPRVVPLSQVVRVKVRTVFGISSLRLHTASGRIVLADLFNRADAESAKTQIQALISAATSEEAAVE